MKSRIKSDNPEKLKELGELLISAYQDGRLEVQPKCCGKCAFRTGSQERTDPEEWMAMTRNLCRNDKAIFLCHEGIPGHKEKVDGEPLRVCRGFHVMKGKPVEMYGLVQGDLA